MSFVINSNVASQSWFERAGNWLLGPYQSVLGGKNYVWLQNGQESIRFTWFCSSNGPVETPPLPKWKKRAVLVLGAIPAFFGAVLKGISLATSHKTRSDCLSSQPLEEHALTNETNTTQALRSSIDNKGLQLEFIRAVLQREKYFLDFYAHSIILLPVGISECACPATQSHHRFKTNTRELIEQEILKDLKKPVSEPISILSIGSGGLLEDWMILSKLLFKGYRTIHLTWCDPLTQPEVVENFTKFMKSLERFGITITVTKLTQEHQLEKNFDIAHAIDLDEETPSTLLRLRKSVKPGSYAYYSTGFTIIKFDSDGHAQFLKKKFATTVLAKEVLRKGDKSKEFHYRTTHSEAAHLIHSDLPAVAALVSKGVKKIHVHSPFTSPEESVELAEIFQSLGKGGSEVQFDTEPEKSDFVQAIHSEVPVPFLKGSIKPGGILFYYAPGCGLWRWSEKGAEEVDLSEENNPDNSRKKALQLFSQPTQSENYVPRKEIDPSKYLEGGSQELDFEADLERAPSPSLAPLPVAPIAHNSQKDEEDQAEEQAQASRDF